MSRKVRPFTFLKQQNVARIDIVNYISHGISKVSGSSESGDQHAEAGQEESPQEGSSNNPLESYALNLNAEAEAGRIDPLVGRELEVERVVQVLSRRRKNNPLLVGEPVSVRPL